MDKKEDKRKKIIGFNPGHKTIMIEGVEFGCNTRSFNPAPKED